MKILQYFELLNYTKPNQENNQTTGQNVEFANDGNSLYKTEN